MKNKILYVVIGMLLITTVFLYFSNRRVVNQRIELAQTLNEERLEFKKQVNKLGDTIEVQNQTILSQKEAIASGLLKIEDLQANNIKYIQAYLRVKEKAKNLEELIASWEEEIDTIFIEKDGYDWLRLPAPFLYTDEWIQLNGFVQRIGVTFPPGGIKIYSEPTFTVGKQNRYNTKFMNFFTRPDPVVIYENKSPYFVTGEMENVIIEEDIPFYKKAWFWGAVGFSLGIIIGN